ncbi:MAG: hypothetical protein F4X19_14150 [Acidobacteria bacterium]|nr:hypothetical protein [Acidobacteriota bacterium]
MSDYDNLDSTAVDRLARVAIQDINPDEVKSPALQRLIHDIQEETPAPSAYNRMHNRHNRGR